MRLATALLVGAWVLIAAAVLLQTRVAWRNHLRREAMERAAGNKALRQRMYGLVAGRGEPVEAVVHAEHMRGWVWIRVTPRPPMPGERRKIQAHDEQMGWAMTQRAARRKMERENRNERGSADLQDMVFLVFGLILAAFVLSKVGADMSPGDVLDWLIDKATEVLRAVAGVLRS